MDVMLHPAVNLDFAKAGYLVSVDGRHKRHIIGLDMIARDTIAAGVTVSWGCTPHLQAGWCDWRERHIVLAPRLYWCLPFLIRDVWSHELGHVVEGPSQERARLWQQKQYRDLLMPVWAA